MPVAIGTRVGLYEVTSAIGAGGMGEVYRARDSKLGRDVAIKVLPAALAHDADYLARFQREAQVLASLNHPNIAAIYGLEENAIVMELVEGPTLADRIAQGPLPLEEALPIAKQIADALEAAHERGIIHRDLKPANVKITPAGVVKVLDFGLAKATGASASSAVNAANSPTLTIHATTAGVILGTAAYMSPEQAAGKPVDRRADIWSFGVVLWEMLTGRQLFQGETVSHTLADVLKGDIDIDAVPAGCVRDLLRRCLDRNAKTRLRDIGEVRVALDQPLVEQAPVRRARFSWWVPVAVAALLLAGVFAMLWSRSLKSQTQPQPLRRFTITPPDFALEPDRETALISPDGRRLAYLAASKLWIRDLDSEDARPVPNSDGAVAPSCSPDGEFVAFQAAGQIWKAAAASGSSVPISDHGTPMISIAWSADGKDILLNPGLNILTRPADGGRGRVLLTWDERSAFRSVHPLPIGSGKQALLLEIGSPGRLQVANLSTQETKDLSVSGSSPVYSSTGHVLFTRPSRSRGTDIWAVAFSLESLQATGEPFPLLRGASMPSISRDGTLVSTDAAMFEAVVRDRTGRRMGSLGMPQAGMLALAVSPDGKQLAVSAVENDNEDIWIHHPARGVKTRLTSHPERDARPLWTADGKSVVWSAERGRSFQILRRMADGSGEAGGAG